MAQAFIPNYRDLLKCLHCDGLGIVMDILKNSPTKICAACKGTGLHSESEEKKK